MVEHPQFRLGAVIAVALLIAFVVWLLVRGGGSSTPAQAPERAGAVPATRSSLAALARSSRLPVYWAGPRTGYTYELTRTADGRVFIRYLPPGVPVGSVDPYLTVGTYPFARAYAATTRLAHAKGAMQVKVPGGIGFYQTSAPTNIYLAFPNVNAQIEVYDPSDVRALGLVTSGQIAAVKASSAPSNASVPRQVSKAGLRAVSAALHHPVYWAGARQGSTYELTKAPGGHVFVRYLPPGAKIGTDVPYLTVGTYPVKGAYALTKKLAKQSDSVRVTVGNGGVAFFSRGHPENVYLAYPKTQLQIEVYDPMAGRALALVTSKRIVPVG
jgi:hypothetical protein